METTTQYHERTAMTLFACRDEEIEWEDTLACWQVGCLDAPDQLNGSTRAAHHRLLAPAATMKFFAR